VKPPASLSTAKVFSQWKQQRDAAVNSGLETLVELLHSGALAQAGRWMVNQLESAAAAISPRIDRLRYELAGQNFCGQLMTGSGSAYFGLVRSATQARRVARLLSGKDLGIVFATSSC
jgi:4-diphosphocytidyl-2-C-methyl-D-erythritol kinase